MNMRTWISFRTGIRGVRVGVALPNPAARIYPVSATGLKIWRIGSALIWSALAVWLVFSRDEASRLNEAWWLVTALAWCLWYLFGRVVAALWPPEHGAAVDR
jgi:hypothetical protein